MRTWAFQMLESEAISRTRARFSIWCQGVRADLARQQAEQARVSFEHRLQAKQRTCALDGCDVTFLAVKRQEYCTPEHGQEARNRRKLERRAE